MKVQAVDPLCELVNKKATTPEVHKKAKEGRLKPESGVEAHLRLTILDVYDVTWHVVADDRINPDEDEVGFRQRRQNGQHCRIAGVTTIPIRLAVDHDRLKHMRQAGRGQDGIYRDI